MGPLPVIRCKWCCINTTNGRTYLGNWGNFRQQCKCFKHDSFENRFSFLKSSFGLADSNGPLDNSQCLKWEKRVRAGRLALFQVQDHDCLPQKKLKAIFTFIYSRRCTGCPALFPHPRWHGVIHAAT